MRRFILLTSFFVTTPVLLIFSAFLLLFITYQEKAVLGASFVSNKTISYAALPDNLNVVSDSITQQDARVGKVATLLQDYNSPLAQYSSLIVNLADKYGIDYRLVPAIALQESTGCKRMVKGVTYNCWGFGIYGKKKTSFDSYEEAIDRVTRYFADKKENGVDSLEELGSIYNPTDHNNWKDHVASFMANL